MARSILVDAPHHVTQRGNRGDRTFFSDNDRRIYLEHLRHYCSESGVEILAYCLMLNHIHLIAVPGKEDSLYRAFRPLHSRYAQRINRQFGWRGHLWQGRFFSSILNEPYMWAAIRYVERNPVRAKYVRRAEEYAWSSAAAHCGLRTDPVLTKDKRWIELIEQNSEDWSEWLTTADEGKADILRRNIYKGLPCGNDL